MKYIMQLLLFSDGWLQGNLIIEKLTHDAVDPERPTCPYKATLMLITFTPYV